MFTVKATYRAETRKFSFRSTLFPTYDELCHQLYRVFPISQNYYLSKLLFSPDSSNSARILIAKEVHSAEEYRACLPAIRIRVFPNPLLKFSIFDENPHKAPSASSAAPSFIPHIPATPLGVRAQPPSHSDFRLSDVVDNGFSRNVTSANVSVQTSSPISLYHIPPPPVIFSSFSSEMDADQSNASPTMTNATIGPDRYQSMASPQSHVPQQQESRTKQQSCCAVSQAKSEIQSLMVSFKSDIDRIMANAFGSSSFVNSSAAPCSIHGYIRYCTYCTRELRSSWFACEACPSNVCDSCYDVKAATHQYALGIDHVFSRATCNLCHQVESTSRPICSLPGSVPTLPLPSEDVYRQESCSYIRLAPPIPPLSFLSGSLSTLVNHSTPVPMTAPVTTDNTGVFAKETSPRVSNQFNHPPVINPNLTVPVPGMYTEENALLQPPDTSTANDRSQDVSNAQREPAVTSLMTSTPQPRVPNTPTAASTTVRHIHYGVTCDACQSTIVGVRHKCADCPDYDLCTMCIDSGSAERHNPFHAFFDIEDPSQIRTNFSGDGERIVENTRGQMNDFGRSNASDNAGPTEVHHATCDLCDSRIVGVRYKCLSCPDFDTCSSCFTITDEQHPNHSFIKFHNSADYIPRSANGSFAIHFATCDGCRKAICGVRYKCMHTTCPDFDLCADCEAHPIPVHPITHPLLKLRSPDTVIPASLTSAAASSESLVVEARGRSQSRSISPRSYSRGYLHNPSAPIGPSSHSTSATYPGPVVPPSSTYIPPHIDGYRYRSPSRTPTTILCGRHLSRSRSASRCYTRRSANGRSRSRSPVFAGRPSRSRNLSRSRSRSPVADSRGRRSMHHRSRSASRGVTTYDHHASPSGRGTNRTRSRSSQRCLTSGRSLTLSPPPHQVPGVHESSATSLAHGETQIQKSVTPPQPMVELPGTLLVNFDEPPNNDLMSTRFMSSSTSPQSQSSFKLPPLSLDPSADIFCEFWPRVAQELRHLLQEPSLTSAVHANQDASTLQVPKNGPVTEQVFNLQDAASTSTTGQVSLPVVETSVEISANQAEILQGSKTTLSRRSSASELHSAQPSLNSHPDEVQDETHINEKIVGQDPSVHVSAEQQFSEIPAMGETADQVPRESGPSDNSSDKDSTHNSPTLSATFLRDNTVPNGQLFPPGAEFVKSWRMVNDGGRDWPETTEVVFAAGDSLARDDTDSQRAKVGSVTAGSEVNIWTGELKAPDAPGKYVGYWRLSDGNGNLFGQSIWIDINVAALSTQSDKSSEGSLASSSIVMPASANGPRSGTLSNAELSSSMSSPVTAPILLASESAEDSDSVSLISIPSSNDDDESAWEDSRSHVMVERGMEYVVLYDSSSDEE